ncbi:MAG TPA: FAD-dependent oxidoreductase, partial [Candidatus Saccharimonadales bacterium]
MNKTVVVIGGGAAGTSAAGSLMQLGYKVTIIEKNAQLGGRIKSIKVDQQCFEMGACFVTSGLYANTLKLIKANNLSSDLSAQKTKTFLVKDAVAYSPISLFGGKVLSFKAKLVAMKQFLSTLRHWQRLSLKRMPDAALFDTKSVSESLSSKSEKTLLDNIVQPTLNGYLYWKPENTSRAMLMILTKSVLHAGRSYNLKHGMQQLTKVIASGCSVIIDAEVLMVEEQDDARYKIVYKKDGITETIIVDGVVCATSASVVPRIIKNLTAIQKEFVSSIKYSSAVVVANVYKQPTDMPNFQHAYPRTESDVISSITSQTIRQPNGNNQIVKVFSSGEKAPELLYKT